MKYTTKIILIFVLLVFSFLTGFTYSDLRHAQGTHDLVANLEGVPARLSTALSLTTIDASAGLSPVDTYWSVYSYLDSKYYAFPGQGKLPDSKKLTYAAIRGMMASLGDRYTRFMDPDEYKMMQEDSREDYMGIGALLRKKHGEVTIEEAFPGSPAIRVGLQKNDAIIKVDGKVVTNMELDDARKLIMGPRGTKVKLTIKREGKAQPFEVEVERDLVSPPVVEWHMEDTTNKVGYLKLSGFNENSDLQFDKAIGELESLGMKGLVLDLRNNPGGLLDSAVDIGSRFIENGNIVLIEQGGQINPLKVEQSKHNHEIYKLPIAVLINGNSASASEILAGAIRDHHVGTLVGTTSFGKGLVQSKIPLDDGSAVFITTARYLTPNKHDVNKEHIKPDIVVEPNDDSKVDNQLQKAVQVVQDHLRVSRTASNTKN